MYYTISCCFFTRCNVSVLHFSPVALFSCCKFPLALCSCCTISIARTPTNSYMESFVTIINKAVKYCSKALHLSCSRGSWLRVYYFHVALFSCCPFLILKNMENEQKTENTTQKKTLHSAP